jgi:hypothetical protein
MRDNAVQSQESRVKREQGTMVARLLAAALFSFPLQTVGAMLFGYPINPSFVALALLSLVIFFRPLRLQPNWQIAAALVLWAAGTTIATGNYLSLRSLGVFAILLLPTVVDFPAVAKITAAKWFLRGGILNLALVALDGLRLWLHLPQLDTLTSLIMPGSVEEMDLRYAGFPRIKALFLEPSYCALYLAFLVIFLDIAPAEILSARKRKVLRVLFIGALLLCRGMTGLVVLGAYAAVHLALCLMRMWLRPRLSRKMVVAGGAAILLIISAWVWSDKLAVVENSMVFPQRLEHTAFALTNPGGDNSSEAERLGALAISVAYVAGGSVEQVLAGEGFNSAKEWVSKTYAGQGGGWALGFIANTFSSVLLGTGLVGLALYLLYVRTLRPRAVLGDRRVAFVCYFWAWILAHFATGGLIGYFLWGLLYVYLFLMPVSSHAKAPYAVARTQP